jgi:quinol monooxygenase YgiN
MITFIAHLRVSPKNAPAFEELMTHVVAMTHRHEPGVTYYEFAKSVNDPETYVVIEVYRDVAAQSAHMKTAWVEESLPVSSRLIEGKPQIRQYVSPGSEPVRHLMFPEGGAESTEAI